MEGAWLLAVLVSVAVWGGAEAAPKRSQGRAADVADPAPAQDTAAASQAQAEARNALETAYSVVGYCGVYELFDGERDRLGQCAGAAPTAEETRGCFVALVFDHYDPEQQAQIFDCMTNFLSLIQ